MVEQPGIWRYRAALVRVVDGDTLIVRIDLGFYTAIEQLTVRLLGVDTPEKRGVTKAAGLAAILFATTWLDDASPAARWPLRVETYKDDKPDKYGGRYDARVYRAIDGACLNDDLLSSGHAVPYDGGKKVAL